MKETEFVGFIAGRVRWVYNRRYCFFRANQLPLAVKTSVRTKRRFRSAVMSLCRLDGRMHQLSERERRIISNIMIIREAVASSAIDSISPAADDILRPDIDVTVEGRSVEDVRRYIDALR